MNRYSKLAALARKMRRDPDARDSALVWPVQAGWSDLRLYPTLWLDTELPGGLRAPKCGFLLGFSSGQWDPDIVYRCTETNRGSGNIRVRLFQFGDTDPELGARIPVLEKWLGGEVA